MERQTVAGRPALTVRGELDLSTAARLDEAADKELSNPGSELVVDLTPTTFLDSSGARTLLTVSRKAAAAGVSLYVLCPRTNKPVRLTVDLLDLGAYVPLVNSVAEIPAGIVRGDSGT
ncbi:STAS domain-containing protein [Candidatus Blastococcus massiliensis]|uniref:STAS domain-containing protein n=1 Tax=Candidatus Blastococcus massiliensis TaxID=1470358 RepID=UPI0014135E07|nr:STAS domain-containing protein [Candidatus Blastococcus massiliensis]